MFQIFFFAKCVLQYLSTQNNTCLTVLAVYTSTHRLHLDGVAECSIHELVKQWWLTKYRERTLSCLDGYILHHCIVTQAVGLLVVLFHSVGNKDLRVEEYGHISVGWQWQALKRACDFNLLNCMSILCFLRRKWLVIDYIKAIIFIIDRPAMFAIWKIIAYQKIT